MLSCFIDKELPDKQLSDIEKHIKTCLACRLTVETFNALEASFASCILSTVPEKESVMLKKRIMNKLGSSKQPMSTIIR